MKKKILSLIIISSVLLGFLSGAALADDSKETDGLEEVMVTAQKREQSVNEIGMSIVAFTGDTLKELRVQETSDLAAITPGLSYSDVGSGPPVYTMRGVGFNEGSLQATGTVGVYHDQIVVPFPIMTGGPLMDVERVEILKGPQGTLYGRNTTGGAINYIANKPTDDFESSVTLGYGRFQTFDAEGFISGPLTDVIRARLAFKTTQSSDGWQQSITRDDELGELDRTGVRLLLDADFGESVDALLAVNWWQDNSDTLAPQLLDINYQNPANAPVINVLSRYQIIDARDDNRLADWTEGTSPSKDMKNTTASFTLNWTISEDVTMTSLTSYSKFKDKGSAYNRDGLGGVPYSDPDAAALIPLISLAGGYQPGAILNNSQYTNEADIDAFTQELRFTGATDLVNWIVGGYFNKDTVDSFRPQRFEFGTNSNNLAGSPAFGIQGAIYKAKQKTKTWAVFAHTEWNLADDWMLTVGARYTKDKKDFDGCTLDVFNDVALLFGTTQGSCITVNTTTGVPGLVEKSLDEDSTSGKVALNYSVNDDALLYLSYSRGYKSGSFPTLAATVDVQYLPVTQEKLDAYELGFKWTLAEGAAQLNGAVFYYDYTDKQLLGKVQDPAFGSLFRLQNIPESKVKGAEIELQWTPLDGLFISLAGSFIDTKVKEFVSFTQDSAVPFDLSGSKFPLTPDNEFMALVNYEWPVGEKLMAFVGGDLSYSDGFQTDYSSDEAPLKPVYKVDSYTLLGLRAGVRSSDGRWSLMAWGRNITDEFYASNVYKSIDSIIRTNGMPATYGLTFSYNWN